MSLSLRENSPSHTHNKSLTRLGVGLSGLFLAASMGLNPAAASTGKDRPMLLPPKVFHTAPVAKPKVFCVARATPDNAGDYHYRRLVAMKAASALAYNRNRNGEDITPVSAIAIASYETGIDFELLVMKATLESHMGRYDQPLLGGSARGLFHFMPANWLTLFSWFGADFDNGVYADAAKQIKFDADNEPYVDDPVLKQKILDLRSDHYVSAYIKGMQIRKDERPVLRTVLGREPTYTDYYIAHFLGLERAKMFYRNLRNNPKSTAAPVMTRELSDPNNYGVFYRGKTALTFRQVYDRLDRIITNILNNVESEVKTTMANHRCIPPLVLKKPARQPIPVTIETSVIENKEKGEALTPPPSPQMPS